MPDDSVDFASLRPNTTLKTRWSPLPPTPAFRGLLLAGPQRAVLTSPGPSGPLSLSPYRLVVCASVTRSLLDQRKFAPDENGDPLAGLTITVCEPRLGFAAAGRMPRWPQAIQPDRNATVSDDEAERFVMTCYANPNLPDVVPMPAKAGRYCVHLSWGPWCSPVITIDVSLPE